jgi:hypothetical protein
MFYVHFEYSTTNFPFNHSQKKTFPLTSATWHVHSAGSIKDVLDNTVVAGLSHSVAHVYRQYFCLIGLVLLSYYSL